ncbi:MAG: imidazole glycerol phosphate synthase subunit HisH [Lachnospiraceae bacterium]|nr:imidazole glycerol phosphate synthase subunit HisH [Lachnospiraceae bacterium]
MIAIIDYDAGNIKSVEKALEYLGEKVIITRDKNELLKASGVILPGVGSFKDAMDNLNKYNLCEAIREVTDKKIPFLGICLGLQLIFEKSEESPGVEGLKLLEGEIVKIPEKDDIKIPHIGWNSLKFPNKGRLFKGIKEDSFVYFVHSYYLKAKDPSIVTAVTEYGANIQASVEKDNIFACQFHPEKSSETGLCILKNFIEITKENK